MFCKLLQQLMLLGWLSQAQQQELVIQPPGPAVTALGTNISLSCAGNGTIIWDIRNTQVLSEAQQDAFRNDEIYVPLAQPNESEVTITATVQNSYINTTVVCILERGPLEPLVRSNPVTIMAYGAPSPPTNLTLSLLPQGLGVNLSWTPGSALEGEVVTFVITSFDLALGTSNETRVNSSLVSLNLPPPDGRSCQQFRFTVQAENDFSRSIFNVSEDAVIPTAPFVLEEEEVTTSVSLLGGVLVNISFSAPSPCPEFSVEEYLLEFSEVANSEGVESGVESSSSVVTVTHQTTEETVLIQVTILLPGRQYELTIIANNTAGSAQSNPVTLFTTGLQSSAVILDASSSVANITCTFAAGSTAAGCLAILGSVRQVNISRDPGADIAMEMVLLDPSDVSEDLTVTVAEVTSDGRLGSIIFVPNVIIRNNNTPQTSTQVPTSSNLITTTVTTSETDGDVSTPPAPPPNIDTSVEGSFLSGNTLFILIGAIVGVVLILLLLIVIVIICIMRSKHKKSSRTLALDSAEELKSNYVYGAPPQPSFEESTNFNLENGHQVRSNTYETPHQEDGICEVITVASPTYETVQSAKKNMRIAGGPAVLNPVYGPTGTPNIPGTPNTPATPTTPVSPLSKAANNPIYSETTVTTPKEALPDTSVFSPVYASVGNGAHAVFTERIHYANAPRQTGRIPAFARTHSSDQPSAVPGPLGGARLAFKRANSAGQPSVAPLYEALQPTKRSDSVGGAEEEEIGEVMTRNESYGVLGIARAEHTRT